MYRTLLANYLPVDENDDFFDADDFSLSTLKVVVLNSCLSTFTFSVLRSNDEVLLTLLPERDRGNECSSEYCFVDNPDFSFSS